MKEKGKAGRPFGSVKVGRRPLSETSLARFIKVVERAKKPRDEVLFKLAIWLGLRVQEICNIRLEHVLGLEDSIYISGIKNGRDRTYCVTGQGSDKLWKKILKLKGHFLQSKTGQVYLFPSPKDITKPLSTQAVKMLFKRYAKKAQFGADRSIHDFRHTTGTIMAEKGYNGIQISRWLRHKNVKSTEVYFEKARFGKDDQKMAKDFEAFL